jgi:hypothetical protein
MLGPVLRYARRLAATLVIASVLGLAGCDSGSPPGFAGVACSTSGDCSSGLSCLQYLVPGEAGCTSLGLTCVQPCQTSADCGGASSGYACYAACGTTTICQPAMDAGGQ